MHASQAVVAPVQSGWRQVVADYVALTKPKVQSLLLLTTVCTMEIAGDPSLELIALTVAGGYLSAGGAGAVNHWYDRDIDKLMPRTAGRPVPAGRVSPRAALIYGCVLALLSFLLLAATVNVLSASLAFGGFLGYVFVYTVWLKRRTPQNIVIGGAAGAVPPLVGWAAGASGIGVAPLLMFLVIFVLTPPHLPGACPTPAFRAGPGGGAPPGAPGRPRPPFPAAGGPPRPHAAPAGGA